MLLFVRVVNESFEITEELAAVHSMKDSCTGNEIFLKVKEFIFALGLDFNILKGVTTDGGRNMCGAHTGLVGNVSKAILETGTAAPMAISEVMNVVVQNVNYIRKSALVTVSLRTFLLKLKASTQIFPIIVKFVGSAEVTS